VKASTTISRREEESTMSPLSGSSGTMPSPSVQELDQAIVIACNDLMRMKAQTPRKIVDNSNDRARMTRECEQKEAVLAGRLRTARLSKDLSKYREVCATVFSEAGLAVPAMVASRHAQLCLNVHLMTILENQSELLEKHKHIEVIQLEDQMNQIQQERCISENSMLRHIIDLEKQIKELQEPLAKCKHPPPKKGSVSRQKSSDSSRTIDTASSDVSFDEEDVAIQKEPSIFQRLWPSAPHRSKSLLA
jgi:hypothetical protein